MKLQQLVIVFAFLLAFQSCSSSRQKKIENLSSISDTQTATVLTVASIDDQRDLALPGYLFTLNHPTDTQLHGTYRIDFDGILKLPYKMAIRTEGKTIPQLQQEVVSAYRPFFQKDIGPAQLALKEKTVWVEVRGQVKKPGRLLVRHDLGLDEIIQKAEGILDNMPPEQFIATVKKGNKSVSANLNQYFRGPRTLCQWVGGETIFIGKSDSLNAAAPMVTIIGGVLKPGEIFYQKDANLFYYLNKTGGIAPNIDLDGGFIVRQSPEGLQKIAFSLRETKSIPLLQPNDVVMLNGETRTMGDKILDNMVKVAVVLSTVALFIIAL
ncbi:MAG: hypothetical protein WCG27_05900 [Pseudomonadota bacterium]